MKDDEAQALYAQFIELQQQAENLSEHLKGMQEQLRQIEKTRETITELRTLKQESDTWVPIAPGAYVKATTKPIEHILLNIGAGVAVEKTPDAVLATLDEHKKVLDELQDAALEELKTTVETIEQIRAQVEKAEHNQGDHSH